jgi:hypothetical protein
MDDALRWKAGEIDDAQMIARLETTERMPSQP